MNIKGYYEPEPPAGKKHLQYKKKKLSHKRWSRRHQTEIVESESQIDTDKRLDVIITSEKYIVSNSMEMSNSDNDSDHD